MDVFCYRMLTCIWLPAAQFQVLLQFRIAFISLSEEKVEIGVPKFRSWLFGGLV